MTSRRQTRQRRFTAPYLVLALVSSICFVVLTGACPAQETETATPQVEEAGQAVERPEEAADLKRIEEFSKRLPPLLRPDLSPKARRMAPMMIFRRWAYTRKPFVASFLFCAFVGLLAAAFFPKQMAVAQECCRRQFWRCIGRAILIGVTISMSVRILHGLQITEPLAVVLVALLQFLLIAGLGVGVSLIGQRLAAVTQLDALDFFKTRPRLATFMKVVIGSLVVAMIIQIPGFGQLPRIGIRIAMLIAILGAGGLFKTKFGTQPLSSG